MKKILLLLLLLTCKLWASDVWDEIVVRRVCREMHIDTTEKYSMPESIERYSYDYNTYEIYYPDKAVEFLLAVREKEELSLNGIVLRKIGAKSIGSVFDFNLIYFFYL